MYSNTKEGKQWKIKTNAKATTANYEEGNKSLVQQLLTLFVLSFMLQGKDTARVIKQQRMLLTFIHDLQ